ncbi:MAG: type I methionyl aminopeptidase [Deltaproteobacteria bacterium]|nr:type I methionyl aminopeptidase [Deltaproteobacteria bacterium]
MIEIKSDRDIEKMRVSCQMAAETLVLVGERLRAGMTTEEINTLVHKDTVRRGAVPSPLNYHGFPKSVCTSINEVVCHGIPGPRRLLPGDIINVDVTTYYNGFHGDTSATFYVGAVSPQARLVTEVARRSLDLAIAVVRDGARIGDIGEVIQGYAEGEGCSVVRDFAGHGIGRRFHCAPQVAHYRLKKGEENPRLRAGMVFTIEPMINLGTWEVEVDPVDKWTARTRDRKLSAQFEHTLLVTQQGCEVLTRRSVPLANSETVDLLASVL